MTDTVDLVVVGAFWGRGRRAGTYGALLMAAYDEETDTFKTICKVGSGFTDEDLKKLPEILKSYEMISGGYSIPIREAEHERLKYRDYDPYYVHGEGQGEKSVRYPPAFLHCISPRP